MGDVVQFRSNHVTKEQVLQLVDAFNGYIWGDASAQTEINKILKSMGFTPKDFPYYN